MRVFSLSLKGVIWDKTYVPHWFLLLVLHFLHPFSLLSVQKQTAKPHAPLTPLQICCRSADKLESESLIFLILNYSRKDPVSICAHLRQIFKAIMALKDIDYEVIFET